MNKDKDRRGLIERYSEFMSDTEFLSPEELRSELVESGIDPVVLERRVAEIVEKGTSEMRLSWLKRARERRAIIEKMLVAQHAAKSVEELEEKARAIMISSFGQGARSNVEAYFRKKDSFSEKELEALIKDIEDLDRLEKMSEGKIE